MGLCGSKQDNPKNKTFLLETLIEHQGGINCMGLSEDTSVLVTGSEDATARLWTTQSDRCECIGILKGHEDYINCLAVEDNYVITGSADKTLRKWDMNTCDCVHTFRGHNSLINRIICTGDFIFSTSYDRTARCWDFDTGECIRVFSGHKRGVYPLIFIPADEEEVTPENFDWDGNKDILITGSADFTARSWSFETGKTLQSFKGHNGVITCMSTDPLGKTLFTGSTDQTVRSWNILTGVRLKIFEGHQSSIICMTVVNKIMYTGSSDHTGRSWVTEFGDCTRVYKGHKHTVSCIKYRDGLIFTGCGDEIARCFDAKSGALRRSFKGHESAVNSLQIVDGRLFTGSHDASLRVWDIGGIKEDAGLGGKESVERDPGTDGSGDVSRPASNGHTRIMIDDDQEAPNGHAQLNGNAAPLNGNAAQLGDHVNHGNDSTD